MRTFPKNIDELKETIQNGDFLEVEKIAQDRSLPDEIRKEAGMKHIENSIKSGRWMNILYILGSRRFPEEVCRTAGNSLVKEGKYLEMLAKGKRYPEKIRIKSGEKIIAECKKEKNMKLLEQIAYMHGYPGKIREIALEALDNMKAIRMRKRALRKLGPGNVTQKKKKQMKMATA